MRPARVETENRILTQPGDTEVTESELGAGIGAGSNTGSRADVIVQNRGTRRLVRAQNINVFNNARDVRFLIGLPTADASAAKPNTTRQAISRLGATKPLTRLRQFIIIQRKKLIVLGSDLLDQAFSPR